MMIFSCRTSVVPEGKNYGSCMFLDWSGSMVYNIEYTMKQLIVSCDVL
jgi:hypothetical protein